MINIELIFTKRFINFISIIISIIFFFIINFNFINPINSNLNYEDNKLISKKIPENEIEENIVKEENNQEDINVNVENKIEENYFWYIEIPVISLKAPINKGVDLNTLKSAVGHFENTSFDYGNIGLAAHNRRI